MALTYFDHCMVVRDNESAMFASALLTIVLLVVQMVIDEARSAEMYADAPWVHLSGMRFF